jgi:hypothetical protein
VLKAAKPPACSRFPIRHDPIRIQDVLQTGRGAKLGKQPGDGGVEFPLAVISAKDQQVHQPGNKGHQPHQGAKSAPHPANRRDRLGNINNYRIREVDCAPQEVCRVFVLLPPLFPVEDCRN